MSDIRNAERKKRLAIIVAAEREIAAEARTQYAVLLAAIANDILQDASIVAAIRDPNRGRNQARALWSKLTGNISTVVAKLFRRRFMGTGAPRSELASREATFVTNLKARLADVSDEVYADLNRIIEDGVRAGASQDDIYLELADELTPGQPPYERRLDTVSTTIGRTSAIAAFNAGDQEGFVAISIHDRVPMATKSWLSSHDTKVRDSHFLADEAAENQDIPADAYFQVGGYPALYPGDPELPPEEAVNCRCTSLYSLNGSLVASMGHVNALGLPHGDQALLTVQAHQARDAVLRASRQAIVAQVGMQGVQRTVGTDSGGQEGGAIELAEMALRRNPGTMGSDVRGAGTSLRAVRGSDGARAEILADGPLSPNGALAQDSVRPVQHRAGVRGERLADANARDGREVSVVTTPETGLPNGWRGPIAALDVPTGDRRQLCTPPDGVRTREYPLSLTMNHVGDPTGYPVIGAVDRVWAAGDGLLWGEGPFDLGGEAGAEAARQLAANMINTVSIDPDMVQAAINTYGPDGELISSDQLSKETAEQYRLAGVPFASDHPVEANDEGQNSYRLAFTDWRLAGLAMVPIPAYTQARIQPVYDYAPCGPMAGDAIVAAVGGQVFAAKNFGDPKFSEYTPPSIDDDGHFYGHVREHGTCYQYGANAGSGGFCLEPPDSACGYSKFEQHAVKLDDGRTIRVGAITFGDGHYSQGSLKASRAQYNDISTVAAKVNAGTDEFGVWVNGQVVDEYADKAYDLLLSPLSGHWEPDADNDGHLEMIAAHIVVTPGYRARRIVAGFDDAGQPNSLIITTFPTVVETPVAPAAAPVRPRAALVAAMNDFKRAAELSERIRKGTERITAGPTGNS